MIKPIDMTMYVLMMINSEHKYYPSHPIARHTTTNIITNDSLYNINTTVENAFIKSDAEEKENKDAKNSNSSGD